MIFHPAGWQGFIVCLVALALGDVLSNAPPVIPEGASYHRRSLKDMVKLSKPSSVNRVHALADAPQRFVGHPKHAFAAWKQNGEVPDLVLIWKLQSPTLPDATNWLYEAV